MRGCLHIPGKDSLEPGPEFPRLPGGQPRIGEGPRAAVGEFDMSSPNEPIRVPSPSAVEKGRTGIGASESPPPCHRRMLASRIPSDRVPKRPVRRREATVPSRPLGQRHSSILGSASALPKVSTFDSQVRVEHQSSGQEIAKAIAAARQARLIDVPVRPVVPPLLLRLSGIPHADPAARTSPAAA